MTYLMDVIVASSFDYCFELLDSQVSRTKRKYAFLYIDSRPDFTHPLASYGKRTMQN